MTSVLQPVSRSGDWHQLSRGRAGMIGLIIAEASLLGIFVVAYLFYIGKSLSGPYPNEVLEVPVLNTMCLLASSVTVGLTVRALRQGGGVRPASGYH
jgi:cytochrome c oxidase subunit 3